MSEGKWQRLEEIQEKIRALLVERDRLEKELGFRDLVSPSVNLEFPEVRSELKRFWLSEILEAVANVGDDETDQATEVYRKLPEKDGETLNYNTFRAYLKYLRDQGYVDRHKLALSKMGEHKLREISWNARSAYYA